MTIDDETYGRLTDRERECLRRAAHGTAAKSIAPDVGLSYRSVQQYLYSGAQKLGIRGSVQAGIALLQYEASNRIEHVQPVQTETKSVAPTSGDLLEAVSGDLPGRPSSQPIGHILRDVPLAFESASLVVRSDEDRASGEGRNVELSTGQRLRIILEWLIGPPLAFAVVVLLLLGITAIQHWVNAP